jgi:single-strand DNA-binding protein
MADSNVVTLVGTLGADPEYRRTPTGKDVVDFNLVTNDRVRGADGAWTDGAASWFKVTAWNQLARNAAMSFKKGQRVIALGVVRVETWQMRDGGTGRTMALTASALGHDVLFGTSSFVKGDAQVRQPPQPLAVERPSEDGWSGSSAEDRPAAEPVTAAGVAAAAAAPAQPQWSTMIDEVETPF